MAPANSEFTAFWIGLELTVYEQDNRNCNDFTLLWVLSVDIELDPRQRDPAFATRPSDAADPGVEHTVDAITNDDALGPLS